uniref:tigger transposable element derived 5-like n=1 Tax=Myxine glutinosa TaxID=7769 RepID=UPI00358F3C65
MEQTARKRKSFSVKDKLHALDAIKTKSQTQVARDPGIPESTLRGWKSQEEKLRVSLCKVEEEAGLKAKHLKTAKDGSLDDSLYEWFVQARSEGLPISGPILKAQAEKFDKQINGETSQFKASNGWLDRFKRRHEISQVLVSGEIRSADSAIASEYPAQLKTLLEEGGYVEKQVYNCDETGLCYKMLCTLASKDDAHRREGFKQRKDRVTLLFCVKRDWNT